MISKKQKANGTTKKRWDWDWIFWWKINQTELQDQVSQYHALGWSRSFRKLSVLCMAVSIVITVLMIFFGASAPSAYLDVAIMAVLAPFIYFGYRAAMVAAMVLWTFEKFAFFLPGFGGNLPNGGNLFTQIVWWCFYMHAFYFSFRVEQTRRKTSLAVPESTS
jgi:hypothetical protein